MFTFHSVEQIRHFHHRQEANRASQGFGGRSVHYASGKTLGGGSARNFLWYMSSIGAYQNWANHVDDASYTFTDLDPYVRRSVHFNPPTESLRPVNASVSIDTTSFSASGVLPGLGKWHIILVRRRPEQIRVAPGARFCRWRSFWVFVYRLD